jgi:hypothetical protein
MIGEVERFETFERNRAVDHLLSETGASLWFDLETGGLVVLASKPDADDILKRRQGNGGLEFVCLMLDHAVVRAVQKLNHAATTEGQ